jgi:hypothetical protein
MRSSVCAGSGVSIRGIGFAEAGIPSKYFWAQPSASSDLKSPTMISVALFGL